MNRHEFLRSIMDDALEAGYRPPAIDDLCAPKLPADVASRAVLKSFGEIRIGITMDLARYFAAYTLEEQFADFRALGYPEYGAHFILHETPFLPGRRNGRITTWQEGLWSEARDGLIFKYGFPAVMAICGALDIDPRRFDSNL